MATTSKNIIRVKEPLQEGDTHRLLFQYKEGGVAAELPEGHGMVCALYDRKWNPIASAKTFDGTLSDDGGGLYAMTIDHATSMLMTSTVYLEVTIATADLSLVDHAKQVVEFEVETRRNNKIIGGNGNG